MPADDYEYLRRDRDQLMDEMEKTGQALAALKKDYDSSVRDVISLLNIIADIREESGVGGKPMLADLPGLIGAQVLALAEIASMSPSALWPGQRSHLAEPDRCASCRAMIDRARGVLGQKAWPAQPGTPA